MQQTSILALRYGIATPTGSRLCRRFKARKSSRKKSVRKQLFSPRRIFKQLDINSFVEAPACMVKLRVSVVKKELDTDELTVSELIKEDEKLQAEVNNRINNQFLDHVEDLLVESAVEHARELVDQRELALAYMSV